MNLFISQSWGTRNLSFQIDKRKKIAKAISVACGQEVFVVNDYVDYSAELKNPLMFLGRSLEALASADCAFFPSGWERFRDCRIEHEICKEYGIKILKD